VLEAEKKKLEAEKKAEKETEDAIKR